MNHWACLHGGPRQPGLPDSDFRRLPAVPMTIHRGDHVWRIVNLDGRGDGQDRIYDYEYTGLKG